jgi:hypothetical protein
MKNPNFSVKLDKVGSFVWNNIDGNHSIGQIAEIMKKEFGESVEPVHDRLQQFMTSLYQNGFISIR